jgi:hypothetical protein
LRPSFFLLLPFPIFVSGAVIFWLLLLHDFLTFALGGRVAIFPVQLSILAIIIFLLLFRYDPPLFWRGGMLASILIRLMPRCHFSNVSIAVKIKQNCVSPSELCSALYSVLDSRPFSSRLSHAPWASNVFVLQNVNRFGRLRRFFPSK